MAILDICGALRTTAIMALDAILHVAPVDIAGRCLAANAAIRLKAARYKTGRDTLIFFTASITFLSV